jgi:hypothetical protein
MYFPCHPTDLTPFLRSLDSPYLKNEEIVGKSLILGNLRTLFQQLAVVHFD